MSSERSLIQKLTIEICNKLNIPNEPYNTENEMMANFMLDLFEKSTTNLEDFKTKLKTMGAPDLAEDNFIRKINNLIKSYSSDSQSTKIKLENGGTATAIFDSSLPNVKTNYNGKALDGIKKEHKTEKEEEEEEEEEDLIPWPNNKRKFRSDYEPPFKREKLEEDEEPVLDKIYKGRVVNMTNFGAFIRLYGIKPLVSSRNRYIDGLCHISAISKDRIEHPSDVLKKDQEVYVKLVDIQRNGKISLSMKNINQMNGQEEEEEYHSGDRFRRGRQQAPIGESVGNLKKRLSSPERWEIRQLIASGVLSAKDYPELAEDVNAAFAQDLEDNTEANEDVEIVLNTDEPPFLQGQKYHAKDLAAPARIRRPKGSLNRVAISGSALVKERKEKKLQELRRLEKEKRHKAIQRNKNSDDPLLNYDDEGDLLERNIDEEDEDDPENQARLTLIESEWKRQIKQQSLGKRTNLSIKEQRESLPVFKMRSTLVKAVKENQFMVIIGETGSGKTTQITQYLAEEGFNNNNKIIACTQPRRVAAVSVAKRVAEEVGCKVGQEVGYTIRFEDITSKDTKIKYMTDGMLQREALVDPDMSKYSVIMLDEAHERTIATDILFSLLKKACKKNPDLKVIVTSATLDAEKFSKFFYDCPIVSIPGKTFPVEVYYTNEPEMDYVSACLDAVMEIHTTQPSGDILVFLTGQEEIDTCCEALFERTKILGDAIPELIILPVYSSLPSEMQTKIFEPTPKGKRKVIVATNIAETSITIDGIYYVIDPGFVKLNAYDPKLGMDSLVISPISQAQANQRKGRAGRTGPGKCFRLYTQSAFNNEMMPQTVPEIQRQNLSRTMLMLKAMGIDDLLNFEFLDPPQTNTILSSLEELYTMGALDNDGYLTNLGRKMADFPMDPALSKTLIASIEFKCAEEILTIVAMLSVQSIFYRPREKQNQADQKRAKFNHPHGDHLTLLNVYQMWEKNNFSKSWCEDNFIHERSMKRARDVKLQLIQIMKKYRHPILSCGNDTDRIRKTLCSGYFRNSAKKNTTGGCYKTLVEKNTIYMHPSSSLFQKQTGDYVIYHTLLLTTKEYMHCVTIIDPKWLIELAPNFFRFNDPHELSDYKKRERIQPLYNKFDPKQSWRLTKSRRKM